MKYLLVDVDLLKTQLNELENLVEAGNDLYGLENLVSEIVEPLENDDLVYLVKQSK